MRAALLCAWCLAEGRPAFIRWTETTDGGASHGICQYHAQGFAAQLAAPDHAHTYCELLAGGEQPEDAAALTDLQVAEDCLRRRLGREPTTAEVEREYRRM